ncbi:MAG: LysE family translocator [Rhodobacter sp.]|nr:LysE family translocator [Rhodobacter sp.]
MDLASHLPQLILAWSIQAMAVLSPGPAVALILGVAAAQGRAASMAVVSGITGSALLWSTGTALGLAALFAQFADLVLIVRIVGAGYMAYLAYRAFRTALAPPALHIGAPAARGFARNAAMGFVMQVSNPKAIFFWLAIAAVGGVGEAPAPVIAVFVAGALVITFIGHGAYALILSSVPVRRAYVSARRWVEGALGVFFAYFAFRLATERS